MVEFGVQLQLGMFQDLDSNARAPHCGCLGTIGCASCMGPNILPPRGWLSAFAALVLGWRGQSLPSGGHMLLVNLGLTYHRAATCLEAGRRHSAALVLERAPSWPREWVDTAKRQAPGHEGDCNRRQRQAPGQVQLASSRAVNMDGLRGAFKSKTGLFDKAQNHPKAAQADDVAGPSEKKSRTERDKAPQQDHVPKDPRISEAALRFKPDDVPLEEFLEMRERAKQQLRQYEAAGIQMDTYITSSGAVWTRDIFKELELLP
ncbi:unnamed protein product [Symbiodinium microadriaticum]|nr:unnamed protein product [Symbiodinium sp. KB8]CAE7265522.1 unnamed protein product [Symbiodinium microadriaticum]